MNRRDKLLAGLDLRQIRAMEIGALDKPIVPPDTPGVFYVDHADTGTLRQKYLDDPHVNKDRLVNVGGVWGDRTLAEASAGAGPFDLIVASHVVEHVPDLITWLAELRSVLSTTGEVRLAIPDRRYTFDYLRRETQVADVLDAWIQRARRPLTRCVLDHALHVGTVDTAEAWSPGYDGRGVKTWLTSEQAIAKAREALVDGQYHDVHCWVFTPHSFARLMADMARHGVLGLRCSGFHDTLPGDLEFFVNFSASDDRDAILASWVQMERQLQAPAADVAPAPVAYVKPRKSALSRLWRRLRGRAPA